MEYCNECERFIDPIVEEHQDLETGETKRWLICPLCDGHDISELPEDDPREER